MAPAGYRKFTTHAILSLKRNVEIDQQPEAGTLSMSGECEP
jgi:hypothetical protein